MAKIKIVKLEGVAKTYFLDHIEVPALRGIDLSIDKAEFLSIMGPSGSGKSTLMHLIGCLDRPTSGKVKIDGNDISKMSDDRLAEIRREKIGFIFQQFNLIPRLTAKENVALPMWFAGTSKTRRLKRANELLEIMGIANRADHKPSELSGGQSQRVAIARALANDPEIILADEPTGNLDTKTGGEVFELLKGLTEQGKTVIMVTHDPEFGEKAGRIIHIKDGMIA